VIGVDLARSDLERAKRHDPSVPVVFGDVVRTAFADARFGAVISLGVVEHFEEGPGAALAEVRRLLRPGGVFLVTVPTQNLLRVLVFNRLKELQWILRRLRGRALVFEEYRYSRARFSRLLREAGFEIVGMHPDDFRPPKNMGLYTDARFFQHPERRWELNGAGRLVQRILGGLSPWLLCSGTLWVCRRP
jgi:SAM-dependent methyltransferase